MLVKEALFFYTKDSFMSLEQVVTRFFDLKEAFPLTGGEVLPAVRVAYEAYGTLNAAKDNAILLFHALTGSQHAYGYNPQVEDVGSLWQEDNHEGWWNAQIGPGKSLDTDKYYIICANLLGGCYGTTGPCSLNPLTGKAWAGDFPRVSTSDNARLQAALLDFLGIEKLHALVAPSVGGLVGLTFVTLFPERVQKIVSIGSGYKNSMRNKLLLFEQIMAIETDPRFLGGFYAPEEPPAQGLALARIISHKSFVCLEALEKRARQEVGSFPEALRWYRPQHSYESYMLHQGTKFAKRFDANAYLRIADMWAHYHAAWEVGLETVEELWAQLAPYGHEWLIFGIDTDLCFLPSEQAEFAASLGAAGISVEYHLVESQKGHDSFLLEPELYDAYLKPFLSGQNIPLLGEAQG